MVMMGEPSQSAPPASPPCAPGGITVVVPVYNSRATLPLLADRLEPVLRGLGGPFELILVNDASPDGSWEIVRSLAAARAWIRGLNFPRNYGQHAAVLAGIRAAKYGVVVTIDDDLQNPPEEIPKLLAKLDEGFDVVYGTPDIGQHGLWRNMASRVTKWALQSVMGAATARKVSAYRAFRTRVRDAFERFASPSVSIDVLLTWGTSKFAAVSVKHDPRTIGTSGYTFWKLVHHTINVITGFTTVPLRLATLLGFTFAGFGGVVLAFVLVTWARDGSVPGFPFVASLIAIFSGVQLFALGIMGEYLARIFRRSMDPPTYVVSEEARPAGDLPAPARSHLQPLSGAPLGTPAASAAPFAASGSEAASHA